MIKRFLFATIFILISVLLVTFALAETSGTFGDNLTWVLDDNYTLRISGSGDMPSYMNSSDAPWYSIRGNVHSVVIDENITSIGSNSFCYCFNLTDVSIASSVQSIGGNAFYHCTVLDNVVIPEGVLWTGNSSFRECTQLKTISLPDSLTQIGALTFADCTSLSNIRIPRNVINLGDWAFSGCSSLSSIELPDNNTTFGSAVFQGCSELNSITIPANIQDINWITFSGASINEIIVAEGNSAFTTIDGVLFTSDYSTLIAVPSEKTGFYRIPNSVMTIGEYAFSNAKITNIEFPETLVSVKNRAFAGSQIESVTLPSSVNNLEEYAFTGCKNLRNLTILSMDIIPSGTVINACTNLEHLQYGDQSIDLINGVKSSGTTGEVSYIVDNSLNAYIFGNGSMGDCTSSSLPAWKQSTNIVIMDGVTKIGQYAFNNCKSLISISIPDSVINIGNYAFQNCTALENVVIPDSVTSISYSPFRGCSSLSSVQLSNNIKVISTYAFMGCSNLSTITIPESVISIGLSSFSGCSSLETIIFLSNSTQLGDYCLSGCTNLTLIRYGVDEIHTSNIISTGATGDASWLLDNTTLYIVGTGSTRDYSSSTPWQSNDISDVVLMNGIQRIGDYCFSNCSTLTNIQMAETVTTIGRYAFQSCTGIQSLSIPSNITSIGNYAFTKCTGLTSLELPESELILGNCVFDGCTGLTDINIPKAIISLGQKPFQNCTNLQRATYQPGCKSTGSYTFYGCTNLITVSFPNEMENIDDYAFYGCNSLARVELPETIISIGNYSFYNCTNLSTMNFPQGLERIGSYAFYGTNSFNPTLSDNISNIGNNAFPANKNIRANFGTLTAVALSKASLNFADPIHGNILYRYLFTDDEVTGCKLMKFIDLGSDYVIPSFVTEVNTSAGIPEGLYNGTKEMNLTVSNSSIADNSLIKSLRVKMHLILLDSRLTSTSFQDYTNIYEVTLPESITTLPTGAFSGCANLGAFHVQEGNIYLEEIDGFLVNKNTRILVRCPIGLTGSIEIPQNITGIGRSAFAKCIGLTEVVIHDGILSIDAYAFDNCTGLAGIEMHEGILSIGSYAFNSCSALSSITIPDSCVQIATNAFNSCSAKRYANYESSAAMAISNAGYTFYDPNYPFAMRYTKTNGVITDLEVSAGEKSVTSLTIPEGVTKIMSSAFYNCTNLQEVSLPNSLTTLGYYAFYGCSKITDLYLPDNITSIDSTALTSCNAVLHANLGSETSITLSGKNKLFRDPNYPFSMKYNNTTTRTITIAYADKDITSVSFPEQVTQISGSTFYNCTLLESIVLPEHLSAIEMSAFMNCTGLTEIIIPDSVTSIGTNAFSGCVNLVRVVMPNSITSIGTNAFSGCNDQLTLVVCSGSTAYNYAIDNQIDYEINTNGDYEIAVSTDGVVISKYIGQDTNVVIPTTINELPVVGIGGSAFANCSEIVSITFPGTIRTIAQSAFLNCSSLELINLPDGLMSIGNTAFSGCVRLTEITIPDGITYFGSNVFSGCTIVICANRGGNASILLSKVGYSFRDIESSSELLHVIKNGQKTGTRLIKAPTDYSEYVVPNYISEIADGAFVGCESLRTISFTGGIPFFSTNAIGGNRSIEKIILPNGVIHPSRCRNYGTCGDRAVYSIEGDTLYVYGSGSIRDYYYYPGDRYFNASNTEPWHVYYDDISNLVIGEGITSIGAYDFADMTEITSVSLPSSLKTIGDYAFQNCYWLMNITFPSGINTIRNYAFSDCSRLRIIDFQSGSPTLLSMCFDEVTATVYYLPTSEWANKVQNYGGSLTWVKPNSSCGTNSRWVLDDISVLHLHGDGTVSDATWTQYSDTITKLIIGNDVRGIGNNLLATLSNLNTIIFEGRLPSLENNSFVGVSATCLYDHNNETWTLEQLQNYGGSITWKVYCNYSGASTASPEAIHFDEAQPKDCVTDGFTAHWKCSVCGLAFSDEGLTLHMSDEDRIIPAPGHYLIVAEGFPATCTETGLTDDIFCEVCGEIIQTATEIPLIPHTDIITVPEVLATCTTVGYTAEHRCEVCNELLAEITEIPMIPHTDSISVAAIEPTCTEVGYTAEHRCEICNELLQAAEEIDKLPHTDVISIEAMAPACTLAGYTEEHKCSVCGEILTSSEPIPATGHTYGEPTFVWSDDGHTCSFTFDCIHEDDTMIKSVEAVGSETKAPTCTEMGDTLYTATVTEGEKTYTQTTTRTDIAANGHTPIEDVAVPPTDRNTGLTAGSHCSVCDEVLVAQTIVPALWSYSDDGFTVTAYNGIDTDVTIPTGVTALSSTLFKNNTLITSIVVPESVNSVGTYTFYGMSSLTDVWLPDNIAGIVTQTFYNTNAVIHVSKDSQTARLLSVRNRSFTDGEWTLKYKVTSATATPTAVYLTGWSGTNENLILPDNFGGVPLTQIQTGAFAGKDQLKMIVIPDSVTTIAADVFNGCSDNLVICSSMTAMAKTWAENNGFTWGHYPHTLNSTPAKPETCEEAGNISYWTCEACGKYFSDAAGENAIAENAWLIDALGHSLNATAAKDPTCEEAGNTAYWTCETCGKYFNDAAGETTIAENAWVIDALGHTMNATAAKDPTCEGAGNIAYWTCVTCGKYFSDAAGENAIAENAWLIDTLGHSLNATAAKEPTCEEVGNTAYWTCETCGKYFNDAAGENVVAQNSWTIDALGHTLKATPAKAVACVEDGNTAYWTCVTCGKHYADEDGKTEIDADSWIIQAEGHDIVMTPAKAATCTEDGHEIYWTCKVCGQLFSDFAIEIDAPEVIPALGHSWNAPTYVWADDNTTVIATRTCKNGDHPETEIKETTRVLIKAPEETTAGSFKWVNVAFDNTAFVAQEKEETIPALYTMNVLKLPVFLTTIETEAFDSIAAEAIILPNTVTTIEPRAFTNCRNLKYIKIPAGVNIPENAFEGSPIVVVDQN